MSVNSNCDSEVHLKYVPKPHIDRIKKQEDEEQWISGEELCTEGSSDDEPNSSLQSSKKSVSRQRKIKKHRMLCSPQRSPNRLSPLVQLATPSSSSSSVLTSVKLDDKSSKAEEDSEEIQWRPKRGSIKLPSLTQNTMIELSNTHS